MRSYKKAKELLTELIDTEERLPFLQGMILYKIKEEGWWSQEYETFNQFCRVEYSRGENWAYKQIQAFQIAKDVDGLECEFVNEEGEPDCTIVQIENESQARELAKYDSDSERANILAKAVQSSPLVDGKPRITASTIRAAGKALNNGAVPKPPKKKPTSPKDDVPEEVTGQKWCKYQVDQVKAMIAGMDNWKSKHAKGNENWSTVDRCLSDLYSAFKKLAREK